MYRYVLKRLGLIIPTIMVVIFVVFYVLSITPGDPVRIILGPDAPQEDVERLTEELGLNDNFMVRYVRYIKDVVGLDFGKSYRSGKPVFQEILPKFPTTFILAVLSVSMAAILGIPLGVISAIKQHSSLDAALTVGSLVMASIPGFWLALMLQLIFSLWLGILPSSGIGSLAHFIMPVLTLCIPSAAYIARMTRNQMLETMRQDYIRTARAKGANYQVVIWEHALKNALLPIITILGMNFAGSLGGAMITEIVFGLPGIGNAIVNALQLKDIPMVMGSTIFLSTLFMLIMIVVDLIYAYIDPRIKAQFTK